MSDIVLDISLENFFISIALEIFFQDFCQLLAIGSKILPSHFVSPFQSFLIDLTNEEIDFLIGLTSGLVIFTPIPTGKAKAYSANLPKPFIPLMMPLTISLPILAVFLVNDLKPF